MTYEEALEEILTSKQARDFIESHTHSFKEFLKDYPKYEGVEGGILGKDVLDWLGY